jgi:hypothetical protein
VRTAIPVPLPTLSSALHPGGVAHQQLVELARPHRLGRRLGTVGAVVAIDRGRELLQGDYAISSPNLLRNSTNSSKHTLSRGI